MRSSDSRAGSDGQGRDHKGGNRRTSLIHGEHLRNVRVLGDPWATIDGNGHAWWAAHRNGSEGSVTRGSLIEFMYCQDVEIGNLNLQDSPFWTVHPYASRRVHVHDVNISSPPWSDNTDGVDPDSSQDVIIENMIYRGGDDCIAIK